MHPYVVIQNNAFNHSRINTVLICALTSNLDAVRSPGNVRLHKGEANLPKPSVVNVSQLYTVNKRDLIEKIGSLSKEHVQQILDGLRLLTEPREAA